MSVDNQRLCVLFLGTNTILIILILGGMMILRDGEAVNAILDIIKLILPVMVAALTGSQTMAKVLEERTKQTQAIAAPVSGDAAAPGASTQS